MTQPDTRVAPFNSCLIAVYLVECLIRGFVWRCEFFKDSWNVFDLLIVLFGVAQLFLSDLGGLADLRQISMLRLFRIARVIRILKILRRLSSVPGRGDFRWRHSCVGCPVRFRPPLPLWVVVPGPGR